MKKIFSIIILIALLLVSFNFNVNAEATLTNTIVDNTYSIPSYGTNNRFGERMAISSNYVAIGTSDGDSLGYEYSGSINVYNINTLSLIRTIQNPNEVGTSSQDYYSSGIGIYEDDLIGGAPREDYDTLSSGTVYVHDITTGNLTHTIHNPNYYGTSNLDFFGFNIGVSTSGYVAVSAHFEDSATSANTGVIYILNAENNYSVVNVIQNPNYYGTPDNDFFGEFLTVSGNYLIVGCPDEDELDNSASGVVYLFDITTGNLLHTFVNENNYYTPAFDWYGYSTSSNGEYLTITAPNEYDISGPNAGVAYVYDLSTYELIYTLENPNKYSNSYGDKFGWKTSMYGDYLTISALNESDETGTILPSGIVYLYDINTGLEVANIENPNNYGGTINDYFSYESVIYDSKLFVSAFLEDNATFTDVGAVYVFTLDALTPKYDVFFNSNGGTVIDDILDVEVGSYIPLPADPVKAGYTFKGWFSDVSLTKPFDLETKLMPPNDLILYAKWVQDIMPSINETLDNLGLNTTASKVIFSIILIVVSIFLLAYFKPSSYITLLIVLALLVLFIAFGWIPIWILVLLAIILFAIVFMTLKGGN